MAGVLGAIHDYRLVQSGGLIEFPTERLSVVDGTPREKFGPKQSPPPVDRSPPSR